LTTSKGRVHVCYLTQGSVCVHRGCGVKACRCVHDTSACLRGHVCIVQVYRRIRKRTQGIHKCIHERTQTHYRTRSQTRLRLHISAAHAIISYCSHWRTAGRKWLSHQYVERQVGQSGVDLGRAQGTVLVGVATCEQPEKS